ncbi:MAG: hypothetical protein ACREAC_16825 [Blastocatellia bacterium]
MLEYLELPPLTQDDFTVIIFLILAILFGLVILACVIVLARSSREKRKCPFCAETILAEASICKHCRRELPAAEAQPAKASETSTNAEP